MSITLEYPYASPTLTLVLPNPVLGNPESLNIKTSFLQAMDGTTRTYKRTPGSYRLEYTFDRIKRRIYPPACAEDQITEILNFIRASLGSDVKLTDWNGVVWQMKILTTPAEFESLSPYDNRFTLVMEGTKE